MSTVFFVTSKVIWFFLDPANVLLILILVGAGLSLSSKRSLKKVGRWFVTSAAVFCIFLITVPLGSFATHYLENYFPANPVLPEKVDGIIVLGGALDAAMSKARGQTSLGGSVERILEGGRLAEIYPDAKFIYSSGSGLVTDQSLKEANYVAPILVQLGVDMKNVILENNSRNTYENAVFSRDLVTPKPDDTWILVTSASHMPRAYGCFEAIEWPNLIPYPVDFSHKVERNLKPPLSLRSGLGSLGGAMHEWLGLLAYYVTGKTNSLLPVR